MKKYETEIRVLYADTDQMGIVYYVNYIKWFEIGRTEYLRDIGFPYSKLEEEGIWLPVAAVDCEYKAPARYDDVLVIRSWAKELKGATIIMSYEILRKETLELLAKGTSKHPITDTHMKPIRLKNANPALQERIRRDLEEEHE